MSRVAKFGVSKALACPVCNVDVVIVRQNCANDAGVEHWQSGGAVEKRRVGGGDNWAGGRYLMQISQGKDKVELVRASMYDAEVGKKYDVARFSR
jgi:hypothetical protein